MLELFYTISHFGILFMDTEVGAKLHVRVHCK